MTNHIKKANLFNKIEEAILLARKQVSSTVNLVMVHTYFEVGRMIVEDEQEGKERASYGKTVLKDLSKRLTDRFSRGFSVDNLQNMRRFYIAYSKYETPSRIFDNNENSLHSIRQTPNAESYNFKLNWSHYLILMKIEKLEERRFYEIEAEQQNWSESQLKRQYHSSLYERLALSRNKDEVLKLATDGQTVAKPQDLLKNPLTLDFLGLGASASYTESDMEQAIISKLQEFLLELGKGFLFEARQKRFSFDEKHFYVDLVFYNRLLQCYVLIDLKTEELVHQDLGQMQMYINYYNRYVKIDSEKPTIGILLCKKKSDALVELTLPKDANIYASEYSLYLPEKQLLQQKLSEWVSEFEYEKLN
jgi:predicted nuclease of restriction endonuclease-like (RecB) superfamily